ncbi:metallophosphoesterase [Maridesulfovibrio frigidus]|uniref:metallophosphoesterase n=1 Tax=Maridesulfovibrio frigidus TaxID=340956 RepID=UPI0004E1880C|nr:metallophosphoesterase [Maridesulfovibrio frigidus]
MNKTPYHIRLLCTVVILLLLTPLLLGADSGCGAATPYNHVLVISDVHFDPFDDPTIFNDLVNANAADWNAIFAKSTATDLPGYGSETNYPLLSKALNSAASMQKNPSLIILPGDILRHHFASTFNELFGAGVTSSDRNGFILKTLKFFILQVQEHYPNTPVLFTLGNNDSYQGNYLLDAGGEFLSETADMFYTDFLKSQADSSAYSTTYKAGGYYTATFGRDDIIFINLTSILFSKNRPTPVLGDAAYTQLDWLESQLLAARQAGKRAFIVTHIPPGTDVYGTVKQYMKSSGAISDVAPMWHADYQTRFMSIADTYEDVLEVAFSGHTHLDEFRLIFDAARTRNGDPILTCQSISPIFYNNPGYKLFTLNATNWELIDYKAYTLDLTDQNADFKIAYSFQDQYVVGAPTSKGMTDLFTSFGVSSSAKDDYIANYYSDSEHNAINDTNWPSYRMSAGYIRPALYKAAVNASIP